VGDPRRADGEGEGGGAWLGRTGLTVTAALYAPAAGLVFWGNYTVDLVSNTIFGAAVRPAVS
jgi:hypothetical protein